jgi:ankyrin repeat protein
MPPTTRSKRKHQQAEFEKKLLEVANEGDLEQAQELVEIDRVDVNCVDESGYTPLMNAMRGQFIEIAKLLVQHGADVKASAFEGDTALGVLSFYTGTTFTSNTRLLAELLLEHGAPVDSKGPFGCSPLGASINNRNGPMVSFLLDKGANTQRTQVYDKILSAIDFCCRISNADVLQRLLDHDRDFDVNALVPANGGSRPISLLSFVCKRGEIDCPWLYEMAELLLERGALVVFDGVVPNALSPLSTAVKYYDGSLKLIRLLLDNSPYSVPVDENAVLAEMGDGTHPLSDPLKAALLENKTEVAQLLIDHGANVNDRPFLWEFVNDEQHHEAARWLLSARCVNVNRADRDSGETPIWAAAKHGHVTLLKELLHAKANVEMSNHEGETPLWIAAKNGNATVVKELLTANADPQIRNKNGETPLGVAYRFRHKDVFYMLLCCSPLVWPDLRKPLFNRKEVDQQAAFSWLHS